MKTKTILKELDYKEIEENALARQYFHKEGKNKFMKG